MMYTWTLKRQRTCTLIKFQDRVDKGEVFRSVNKAKEGVTAAYGRAWNFHYKKIEIFLNEEGQLFAPTLHKMSGVALGNIWHITG